MHTKEKNIDVFRGIYKANRNLIFKIVMQYSNIDYHVAQEITQEVFVKLYEHFDTYEEEYLLQWLIVSAKNAAINYLKKQNNEILDPNIVLTSDIHMKEVPSAEETIFERLEMEERIRKGQYLLDDLYRVNERWYEAMTMVYCEGKKQKDVAEILGVSVEVLHSVLYRARKWVRENYKPDSEMRRYKE